MRGGVAAVAMVAACHVAAIDYTGKTCPCPGGWVCDVATDTCARTVSPDDAPGGPRDSAMASAFLYRRRITIENTSSSTMPVGFTIRLPLAGVLDPLVAAGKVKPDYSDLRVIGDAPIGERDRIIDPMGGPAPEALSFSLAAELAPGASTSAYALYYDSTTVGSAPATGANVFPLFDDFTAGISTAWLQNDGPTTRNGQLVLRGGHLDGLTTVAATDNVPTISAVELVATVIDPTSDPTVQSQGTFYYWFGYQHTGDFTPVDPWVVWIARGKSSIGAEQKSPVGCESDCEAVVVSQDTAAHYYAIERDPGETRFYEDSAAATAITVMNTEDYSPMVRNFLATSDVDVDYIRGRARISPDPTITLAGEETL